MPIANQEHGNGEGWRPPESPATHTPHTSHTFHTSHSAPYPLFIDLRDQPVVVIGAGAVAQRKIETLLSHGARVAVIAPQATEQIRALAQQGRVALCERAYESGDLAGALLAIAATSSREVNEAVYREAAARPMLVNVVDVPDLCNAIVPSIMERGKLQIAVSSGGASPETAQAIRRELEEEFPAWWETYMDVLGDVRQLIKRRVPGPASVRSPLYRAVLASNLQTRIAAGERPQAEEIYREVVAPLVEPLAGSTQLADKPVDKADHGQEAAR